MDFFYKLERSADADRFAFLDRKKRLNLLSDGKIRRIAVSVYTDLILWYNYSNNLNGGWDHDRYRNQQIYGTALKA